MSKSAIFTEKFLNLDSKFISDEINENGFFSFDNALTNNFIDKILEDVSDSGLALNKTILLVYILKMENSFF